MLFLLIVAEDLDGPRFRASTLLLTLLSQRAAVDAYVKTHRTLTGAGGVVTAKGDPNNRKGVNSIIVSDDATMIAVNTEQRVMLVLMPRLVDGAVLWHCVAVPEKANPLPCKDGGDWLKRNP